MLATILEIIKSVLAAIPILNRWFTKPTEQKNQEGAAKIDDQIDRIETGGRPL